MNRDAAYRIAESAYDVERMRPDPEPYPEWIRAAVDAVLDQVTRDVLKEWHECELYDEMRETDCDDKNIEYYGPAIVYCGALKWVLGVLGVRPEEGHDER